MTRLAPLIAVMLTACSSVDRIAGTEFEPLGPDRFRYEAVMDVIYPADSQDAEAERMDWLKTYLADNGLCGSGFEITERKPVISVHGLLGNAGRIYYQGRCTPFAHQPASVQR